MKHSKSHLPPDPKVARRFRAILEYHGISQNELARRIGVSSGAVSQWATGKNAISTLNASKIGEALGEDPYFILCRTNKGSAGMGLVLGKLEAALGVQLLKKLEPIIDGSGAEIAELVEQFIESQGDSEEQ